jgi:hypothetical protein
MGFVTCGVDESVKASYFSRAPEVELQRKLLTEQRIFIELRNPLGERVAIFRGRDEKSIPTLLKG